MCRSTARFALLLLLLLQCIFWCEAAFGKKTGKPEEAEDEDDNKTLIFGLTGILALMLSVGLLIKGGGKARGNRPRGETLDVVVVATGLPKKGMGWYHLTQLLEMPKVNVVAVVEPFFLNKKLCPKVPPAFSELVKSLKKQGIQVVASVNNLATFKKPTMCLIAGRTPDNPLLFAQCIDKGASVIYLEKPGAPTVDELQDMKDLADSRNVKVYLGYNKNVTPYVQKALELAEMDADAHVLFCHNNSYKRADLPECFTRNSEGILKNMAVHELALLVSFFDITVDTIDTFHVNTSMLFSEKLQVWKPNSTDYITDFSRVTFTITNKSGTQVTIMADRCGGNVSFALVKDSSGQDIEKFEFPTPEAAAEIEEKSKADPEMMPYFFIQSDDYLELKNRVVDSTLAGVDAPGVATIQVGIEALKLAEYGTEELNNALKGLERKSLSYRGEFGNE